MSWKRQFQERASESAESNPDERGDTLIEVLLAIVILGIAGVALLTAFATAITASSQHRQIASLDASVRAASDQVIAQVQQAGNNAFGPANCTNNPLGTSYKPTWNLTGTFTVTSYVVTYWNGSSFVPPASLTNCKGYEPQLWTITIGSGSTSTTVSTVIYDPQAPPVIGGSTPFQLVFLTPTSPGTGTINAPVSPQPIVAVEDQKGNIVYSDASSVALTSSGPGTLSSNCAGVENEGIVSFSGCSFSAQGVYSLTAADSNTGLHKATGASYSITTAPPAKLVFTTAPLNPQTAATNAGATKVTVQEQDAFGNPDPAALTMNLSSSSPNGFFTLTQNGAPATAVNAVSIAAGQSTVSFYYGDTRVGQPTISAASAGLQTATQTETITGAAPVKVTVTPTPPSAGASRSTNVSLGLQLEDQFGNATASTGTTTLMLSTSSSHGFFFASNNHTGGTATLSVPFTNGVGTATAFYGDTALGAPTITAKNGTVTWGSTTVTITVGAPTTIAPTSGSGQSALVNTAFVNPLVATVTDAFGNPVPGVTVTFTPPGSGASGTFTSSNTAVTNAAGVATSETYRANTTAGGPYNVVASATGATPASFPETNVADAAHTVTATSGNGQSAAVGTDFTNPLAATVTDAFGNPVPGVTVTFTPPGSGASGTFTSSNTAVTNAAGVATSDTYRANTTAGGPYNVVASATGATPASFPETNVVKLTATSVASGTGTSSVTSSAFAQTSGNTYVITAFETSSGNGTPTTPTPVVTGGGTPTAIVTNNFGSATSGNCTSSRCYEWVWWYNAGSTNASATVTLAFNNTPQASVVDVVALTGNSTTTPIVTGSTGTASACDSNACITTSRRITANTAAAPATGDIILQLLASDDKITNAVAWNPVSTNLYFHNATSNGGGASLQVNAAIPGQQNESASASGFGGSQDWATIALEIGHA